MCTFCGSTFTIVTIPVDLSSFEVAYFLSGLLVRGGLLMLMCMHLGDGRMQVHIFVITCSSREIRVCSGLVSRNLPPSVFLVLPVM